MMRHFKNEKEKKKEDACNLISLSRRKIDQKQTRNEEAQLKREENTECRILIYSEKVNTGQNSGRRPGKDFEESRVFEKNTALLRRKMKEDLAGFPFVGPEKAISIVQWTD